MDHRLLRLLPPIRTAWPAALILGASGCGNGEPPSVEPSDPVEETQASACTSSFESIQRDIFDRFCAQSACHGADDPAAALDLSGGSTAAALVGASAGTCDGWTLVVPGSPEESLLWQKVHAEQPPCGDRMPIGADLEASELACIREWIAGVSPPDGGAAAEACETCGTPVCVDLSTDPDHCGACGEPCPDGAPCVDGACVCPEGLLACDGSCIEPASDPRHCGGCERACGAEEVCLAGECAADCGELAQCGAACVDTDSSVLHCGGCEAACAAGAACRSGECRCPAGRTLCGGRCVDTETDPEHCGGCGVLCREGETCRAGACECGGAAVSFAADIEPIFAASCTTRGCHSGARPQGDLDLTRGNAHGALVGVSSDQCRDRLRVAPGSPDSSYLMDKLLGRNLCAGSQMPKAGVSLPRDQLDAISGWICRGAPDD